MRPVIDKLSEREQIFLREAWRQYPGTLDFPPDKAPEVEAVAASLIEGGYIERVEHAAQRERRGNDVDPRGWAGYRVTDYWAGRLKAVAERIGWES